MVPPATPSPDAHRPSNQRAASSRLFSLEFLLLLPFASLFLLSRIPAWLCYWLGELRFGQRPKANDYLCSLPNALISTSTPAGRSSFIKASTVCGVGSRMSSKRLCVRISNCSRDFLSTCGERSTVYLFFIVGKGIGPAICAPVRFAVATISVVD